MKLNQTKPTFIMLLLRWKNNEVILPDNHQDDIISGISKLTLHNATPADRGTYKCVSQAADSQTTWTSRCDLYVYSKNIFAFFFYTGICCVYLNGLARPKAVSCYSHLGLI